MQSIQWIPQKWCMFQDFLTLVLGHDLLVVGYCRVVFIFSWKLRSLLVDLVYWQLYFKHLINTYYKHNKFATPIFLLELLMAKSWQPQSEESIASRYCTRCLSSTASSLQVYLPRKFRVSKPTYKHQVKFKPQNVGHTIPLMSRSCKMRSFACCSANGTFQNLSEMWAGSIPFLSSSPYIVAWPLELWKTNLYYNGLRCKTWV